MVILKDIPEYTSFLNDLEVQYELPTGSLSSIMDSESSGGDPNFFRSEKGALGPFQLLPKTAAGLQVNPNDPIDAAIGAAKYLKEGLNAYGGDIEKALSYYHGGPNTEQWGPKTQAYTDKTTMSLEEYARRQAEPEDDLDDMTNAELVEEAYKIGMWKKPVVEPEPSPREIKKQQYKKQQQSSYKLTTDIKNRFSELLDAITGGRPEAPSELDPGMENEILLEEIKDRASKGKSMPTSAMEAIFEGAYGTNLGMFQDKSAHQRTAEEEHPDAYTWGQVGGTLLPGAAGAKLTWVAGKGAAKHVVMPIIRKAGEKGAELVGKGAMKWAGDKALDGAAKMVMMKMGIPSAVSGKVLNSLKAYWKGKSTVNQDKIAKIVEDGMKKGLEGEDFAKAIISALEKMTRGS